MGKLDRREALKAAALGLGTLTTIGSSPSFALQVPLKDLLSKAQTKPSSDRLRDATSSLRKLELASTDILGVGPTDVRTVNDRQAFVNNGSMQAFVANMNPELRRDVLMGTLFAQLAATKKHNRFTDPENWYKFYIDTLEKMGWVIQGFNFTQFSTSGSEFTVSADVIKILLAICTAGESEIIMAAISALNSLKNDDGRIVLFERSSHSARQGAFQICAANEDAGLAVMKLGGFRFDCQNDVTRVLIFSFSSSSASFFKGAETVVLNNDVYSAVRQLIIDKLGEQAKTNIKNIEI